MTSLQYNDLKQVLTLLAISTTDVKGKVISWFFVSVLGLLHEIVVLFSLGWSYCFLHDSAVRPLSLYHAAC